MKKTVIFLCLLLAVLIFVPSVSAQTGFRGQSMSGATGLFSIPSGCVGWEGPGNFGIDFGYRAILNFDDNYGNNSGVSHIPAVTVSLFKCLEISAAFDIQPDNKYWNQDNDNNDLLLGFKFKLPTGKATSFAIGGNIQLINIDNDNKYVYYNAYQPYVAITYPGKFFSMPAETTIVFGKTFYSSKVENNPNTKNNSNIDFGMGFDLILLPDTFGNAVHWIVDFANFGYSDNAWPNGGFYHTNSVWRGILNTGFRFDLSVIPALKKFKFLIDAVFNDLFDDGARSFTFGAVFGFQAA
jgi:hypothetical protein